MKKINAIIAYLMLAIVLVFSGIMFAMTYLNMKAEAETSAPALYSPYAIMLCIFIVAAAGVVFVYAIEAKNKEN